MKVVYVTLGEVLVATITEYYDQTTKANRYKVLVSSLLVGGSSRENLQAAEDFCRHLVPQACRNYLSFIRHEEDRPKNAREC